MDPLIWLQKWFSSNCDGNWEHHNCIRIESIDNPGWLLKIDLSSTDYEILDMDYQLFEISKNDWYGFSVQNKIFTAAGDTMKLSFLILLFKNIIKDGDDNFLSSSSLQSR